MTRIRDHHDYIVKKVPRYGASWVARKLGLPMANVWQYANRRGVRFGEIPGWVRITEAAARAGVSLSFAHHVAKRDGAYRLIGDPRKNSRSKLVIVPEAWADRFAVDRAARREADEAREAGYLTVDELKDMWRVGRGTIIRGVAGKGCLAPHLETARIVRGTGTSRGTIYVNPHDAERIRKALEDGRAKARRLVSTKSLAIELGIQQSYAADLGREAGGEIILFGGRLACFVTPEAADRIRRERA